MIQDVYRTFRPAPHIGENSFRAMPMETADLPTFEAVRDILPEPKWEGHSDAIACYWRTWELAFEHLRQPKHRSGFVANYIDTAFNDCLFMWDSVFIMLFARYGCRAFDFQRTLDNLYASQDDDGFICREIREADGMPRFERHDPSSTGPNVLAWSEWEYYLNFGRKERLQQVFPVLLEYHRWLRRHRTWKDGTYFSSGWGCGMDNQPRLPEGYNVHFEHGHMTWLDTTLQQILSARLLCRIAQEIGREADTVDMKAELDYLVDYVKHQCWDDDSGFLYDVYANGEKSHVKSIAAYWALLADCLDKPRLDQLVAHLNDPKTFKRAHRVPSLAANNPQYNASGGYWLGGVWPPTTYMVLRGLNRCGYDDLAFEIGCNHHRNVVDVFKQSSTLWENYAPESTAPGNPARKDFVGWSGLGPIAVFFEQVLGIQPNVPKKEVIWTIRQTEAHGVDRYPFGTDGELTLQVNARKTPEEQPTGQIASTVPVKVDIRWPGGREVLDVGPE